MAKVRTARQRAASRHNLIKARAKRRRRRVAVTVAAVGLAAGGSYAGRRYHNHLMKPLSMRDLKGTGKMSGVWEEIDPKSFKQFGRRARYQEKARKFRRR